MVRHRLAATWLAFAYLALGVSPSHAWLDAGEIATAAHTLGVQHPPGAVGLSFIMHLASVVPVGTLGFRLGLACAAMVGGAVWFMWRVLERRAVSPWVGWACTIWLLGGLTVLRAGRVAEIYGWTLLLAAVCIWGFDPHRDPEESQTTLHTRQLVAVFAAVVSVWGIGDLRLAFVPLAVTWFVLAIWRRDPVWRLAPLAVGLGCLVALSIPVASARGVAADWGNPQTLPAFWDHVMARSIRTAFAGEMLPRTGAQLVRNAGQLWNVLSADLGVLGIAAGSASLVRLVWRPQSRGQGLVLAWLVAVELIYAMVINPMGVADRQTSHVLILSLVLATGLAAGDAVRDWPRLRVAIVPVAGVALAAQPWLVSFGDGRQTRSWLPHAWSSSALRDQPPGTLVLAQSDDLSAGSMALQHFEGTRPDVVVVTAQHLHKDAPDRLAADAPLGRRFARDRTRRLYVAAHRLAPPDFDPEAARIIAALSVWTDPVALELPATGVLATTPVWGGAGALPLGRTAGEPEAVSVRAHELLDRFAVDVRGEDDERRLARTIAGDIRSRLLVFGFSPERVDSSIHAYRFILAEIDPGHASSMVALGALYDRSGSAADAIAWTRRALELEPHRVTALSNLALYLSRTSAGLEEARELAERAVALSPETSASAARARLRDVCAAQGDEACVDRMASALETKRED